MHNLILTLNTPINHNNRRTYSRSAIFYFQLQIPAISLAYGFQSSNEIRVYIHGSAACFGRPVKWANQMVCCSDKNNLPPLLSF